MQAVVKKMMTSDLLEFFCLKDWTRNFVAVVANQYIWLSLMLLACWDRSYTLSALVKRLELFPLCLEIMSCIYPSCSSMSKTSSIFMLHENDFSTI
jgi:hypothetical protein